MRNNPLTEIEERLSRVQSPEPPADLLERIQADIPRHLPLADGPEISRRFPFLPRRMQLMAASLFVVVVGGLVAYRVTERAPRPAEQMEAEIASAGTVDSTAVRSIEVEVETGRVLADTRAEASQPSASGSAAGSKPDGLRTDGDSVAREDLSAEHKPSGESLLRQQTVPSPSLSPDDGSELKTIGSEQQRPTSVEIGRDRSSLPGARKPSPTEVDELRESTTPAEANFADGTAAAVGGVHHPAVSNRPEAVAPPPPAAAARLEEGRAKRAPTASKKEIGERPYLPPPVTPSPSTGGTAEPNDQPYGDMFFRTYGTNPFVDTEDDPQSTFGLDVDTGSYTLARSYLERGHLPPPEAIRVEEFVNFFDYGDPAPQRGEFTVSLEGAPSPWARGPRYQLLRIGLRGREIASADRKDATLVFVVDVSGSMARENRIGLVKEALRMLLDQLGPNDRVGLVVYGNRGRVLLEPSHDLGAVEGAIDRLTTNGSTNAEEGLVLGFDLARRYFRPNAINRIILCSDGVANVGRTGPESILARIAREAEGGIELTTVGFGMGNYNDILMEQLADQGDGNYAYVDTLDEAHRVFVENLTATLQTIAADAKIQVEFDPRTVSRYRLLGYENRDVADHRFRDDSVDAGEIGAGHAVSALYEIKLSENGSRRRSLGEVRLRYRSKRSGRIVEDSLEIRRTDFERTWRSASPSLQLAAVAAEFAEILKGSYWTKETDIAGLIQRARAVARDLPEDRDVAELVDLAHRAARSIE